MMILGLPAFDVLFVMIKRFSSRHNYKIKDRFLFVFEADNNHLHHILLSSGISKKRTLILLYLLSVLISVIALFSFFNREIINLLYSVIFILVIIFLIRFIFSLRIKMNKILVIGGVGYIGSHLVYELCDNGYTVTVLDNLTSGFEDNIDKRSKFIKDSYTNYSLMNIILKEYDTVIFLAALKAAGESMVDPLKYSQKNIIDSLKLINLCVKNNVKNFIFSSSAAVYGLPKYLPIDENHDLNPINYYGFTKLSIEKSVNMV